MSASNNQPGGAFWWRLPDDETALMSLGLAEVKCYLVVMRAIQRDRNGGKLSLRQIARRTGLSSLGNVHAVMADLVKRGMLACEVIPGRMAVYGLPTAWRNCSAGVEQLDSNPAPASVPNCSTGAEQLKRSAPAFLEQHCSAGVEQNCSTGAEQHLECSEYSELSSSSPGCNGRVVEQVEASPTTTSEKLNSKRQLEPWPWSDGEFEEARADMRQWANVTMLPPIGVTQRVLKHMLNPVDRRLWMSDLSARGGRPRKSPPWGFLESDAEKWPVERADVQRQVEAQRAVTEAEAKSANEANAIAELEAEAAMKLYEQQQRAQQEFIDAAGARGWPRDSKSMCPFCYGFGRRDVDTGALCDCGSGRKLRLKLEQDRARVESTPAAPPPVREPRPFREPGRHRHGAQRVSL